VLLLISVSAYFVMCLSVKCMPSVSVSTAARTITCAGDPRDPYDVGCITFDDDGACPSKGDCADDAGCLTYDGEGDGAFGSHTMPTDDGARSCFRDSHAGDRKYSSGSYSVSTDVVVTSGCPVVGAVSGTVCT
jgi:hypothetical protein